MNKHKILTVSYGAFSCTLEGFDDSFDTMKAVADYFRDLAADDPHFGAEPARAPAEGQTMIGDGSTSKSAEEEKCQINADQNAFSPAAQNLTQTEQPSAASDKMDLKTSQQVEGPEQAFSAFFAQSPSLPPLNDAEEDAAYDVMADTKAPHETVGDALATAISSQSGESIAKKLARMRAVVGRREDTSARVPLESDDAATPSPKAMIGPVLQLKDTEMVSGDLGVSDEPPYRTDARNEPTEDETRDVSDSSAARQTQMPEPVQTKHDQQHNDSDETDDDLSALLHRIEAESTACDDEDTDDAHLEEDVNIFAEDPYIEGEALEIGDVSKSDEASNVAVAPAQENAREQQSPTATSRADAPTQDAARLMNVDRTELDATIAKGDLEKVDDPGVENNDARAAQRQDQRMHLPDIGADNGGDINISRLLVEAEQHMAEPEGATRRSAFAHLRAAVAARFADKSISRDLRDKEEENTQAFKSDLAEVVPPRRPVASGARKDQTPQDGRPAPLKLVAEQRVDPEDTKDGSVSARRVATPENDTFEGGGDFELFTANIGASKLPDVMEAAVSYLSYVERYEAFSRLQVMSLVRLAKGLDFSREDSLRCFGKLLRTGKIVKVRGGRFRATQSIGFQPNTREAG